MVKETLLNLIKMHLMKEAQKAPHKALQWQGVDEICLEMLKVLDINIYY